MVFVKGNHEDFVWLDAQHDPEVLPGLFCIRNGRTMDLAKGLGALTAWATPRWGARAAWELALGSIAALALVAMALLAFPWRVRPRS